MAALLFSPSSVSYGVFRSETVPPPQSPNPSESENSLSQVASSNSGASQPERRQSKSLRNMFGVRSKNKAYTPALPQIGGADDRLPYQDGSSYHLELTPTELNDDISISRMSTNAGSSHSSGASYVESMTGGHPHMTDKLLRVFGARSPLAGAKPDENRPPTRQRDSYISTTSKRSDEKPPTSAPTIIAVTSKWEPPPFCKGLSGAVKHGSLMTCGVTANAVIYLSTHDNKGKNVAVLGYGPDPAKAEKAKEKHHQQVIKTLEKADWSRKIYVLTSTGHILQFSPDGAFNRPPEQSIRLCRHSVAFATDVIPGRHWVLQITMVFDALSVITPTETAVNPPPPPKQRPGSKSTYIKPVKQFLLVMDNGEDLDSWLTAIRHEIDVLGGLVSKPESIATKTIEEDVTNVLREPAQNSMSTESVNTFRQPASSQPPVRPPHPDNFQSTTFPQPPVRPQHPDTYRPSTSSQEPARSSHPDTFRQPISSQEFVYTQHLESEPEPQSWSQEESNSNPNRAINTLSSATSARSIEERLLDSLRDSNTYSQPRSSSGRTFLTSPSPSRGSSPNASPMKESFPTFDDEELGRYGFGEFGQQRLNAPPAGIRERRRSNGRAPVLESVVARERLVDEDAGSATPTNDAGPGRRIARKPPPTTVNTARLSIVEDQPSPALHDQTPTTSHSPAPPAISPKSRARALRTDIPVPPRSARRQSSLPQEPSPPTSSIPQESSSPPPSPTTSEDEFQFHHWTSRLSPPPSRTSSSPSLASAEYVSGPHSPTPPPLPLFSYPFPTRSPPLADQPLSPAPLSPHTARANAKAMTARDKRASLIMSNKRDSIVLTREKRRPAPPKPLAARTYISLSPSAVEDGMGGYGILGGGYSGGGGGYYAGSAGGYPGSGAGYGAGYGALGGGVSTGRVVKGGERMVIRERGDRGPDRPDRGERVVERGPERGSERPPTRDGRPKSRKGPNGVVDAGPPLAPPPTRGLPPVPGPNGPKPGAVELGGYVDEMRRRR